MRETMFWCIRLAAEYTAIVLLFSIAIVFPHLVVWIVVAFLLGTRQHALGIIGHWAMHGLLPRWIMWVSFVPIGVDPSTYRISHKSHHNWLGTKADPERKVVEKYRARWGRLRFRDLLADVLFLHLDEIVDIMGMLTSARAILIYVVLVSILYVLIDPYALLWPAGMSGSLISHRVRARFEHDHLLRPGVTFQNSKPSLWLRAMFLPHYAWLHAEHHSYPRIRVWN